MLSRLKQWFKNERAWHAEHVAAWTPVTVAGADGLTHFQRQCSAALLKIVPSLQLQLEEMEQKVPKECYLVGALPGTNAKVFIYTSSSNVHEPGRDFIAEEWDFKTPEELINALVQEVKGRVAI